MRLQIKDFGAEARSKLPQRQYPMDAGADVFALKEMILNPGKPEVVPLGFGFSDLPNGKVGLVMPKSSLSSRGIICQPVPIDASYDGEVHAIVVNAGQRPYVLGEGEKIGQLMIFTVDYPEFTTEPLKRRQTNGFGSTGK